MKVITKEEALSGNLCPECADFLKTHEVLEEPAVYIGNAFECKKCNLQFDMMGDKIATIWKIL